MYVTFNKISLLHQANDSIIDFMCDKMDLWISNQKRNIYKMSPSMIVEGKPNTGFNRGRIVSGSDVIYWNQLQPGFPWLSLVKNGLEPYLLFQIPNLESGFATSLEYILTHNPTYTMF